MADTEPSIFYIILVVLLLVYWKNQVRCTLVARGYLGLFSFSFLREGLDDLACLIASIQKKTIPIKFDHLAEKSDKGSFLGGKIRYRTFI
jgi:hypothetical protein